MCHVDRRRWIALTVAGLACTAKLRARARPAVAAETRDVAGFDGVRWEGGGELTIAQTGRERLVIEAEPALLPRIVSEVSGRLLRIGFARGQRVVSEHPIRFRLEVRTLTLLDVGGAGNVRAGPLSVPTLALTLGGSNDIHLASLAAERLQARLDGAGGLRIGGGQVDTQRVVIGGACTYDAAALQSREAELAIDGSGEMRVAVAERLVARIGGSGQVLYRGRPQVQGTVTGAGLVRPEPGH